MPFSRERRFDKVLENLGKSVAGSVDSDVMDFEGEYHNSNKDEDIPASFEFKPLKERKRKRAPRKPWDLHQIYVGPGRKYRANLMFAPRRAEACWVWTFKKERDNEPKEIEQARQRAEEHWNLIRGKYEENT